MRVFLLVFLGGCVGGTDAHGPACLPEEWQVLQQLGASEAEARRFMENRYGDAVLPRPSATYRPFYETLLAGGVGTRFIEPTFGFEVTLVATSATFFNTEKSFFNADGSMAFLKTKSRRWSFLDGEDGSLLADLDLSWQGESEFGKTWWHGTDPTRIVMLVEDHLLHYDIDSEQHEVIARSPHGPFYDKPAGGDGNTIVANPITGGNYLLVTHGGKRSKAQVIDTNTGLLARHEWDPIEKLWRIEHVPWTADAERTFTLPDIDYATVSRAHPTTGEQYLIVGNEDAGATEVWDFNGQRLGVLHSNVNHMTTILRRGSNGDHTLGVAMKVVAGTEEETGATRGERVLRTFTAETDAGGQRTIQTGTRVALSWSSQASNATMSGGQYSWASDDSTFLTTTSDPSEQGLSGWKFGWGEVMELSTNDEDPTFRRVAHHLITDWGGNVARQPEVALRPDGRAALYKSMFLDRDVTGDGYILFVKLPPRAPAMYRVAPPACE